MVPAAFALAAACFATGERVPVAGGLGWDGRTYAAWAQDFRNEVFVKGVDSYYVQRILPSAVVHYALRALGAPPTERNVLRGFCALDVGLVTLAAAFWVGVAGQLAVSARGRWLGFVCLFVNYVVLKHTVYCPVTTDVTAFALGAAMLWCYLGGRTLSLAAVMVAGAFAWPTTLPVGVLLLLFPKRCDGNSATAGTAAAHPRRRWHLPAAALLSAAALAGIEYGLRRPVHPALLPFMTPARSVLNLSLAVALLYVFGGAACLLEYSGPFALRGLLTWRRLGAGVLALGLVLTVRYAQQRWAVKASPFGAGTLLPETAHTAVTRPGVFLVTHCAYYGPAFLLALFLWRPVCRLLHHHGTGLALAAGAALLLSLNSQSRYCLNVWVMLVPFVVKAADGLGWGPRQYGLFAGLSLLASKVWLTINTGPFTGDLLAFPDQGMFMSHGPWISDAMYLAQGAAALVVAALLYAVCLRGTSTADSQAPDLAARRAA
jgi:hypothetical protein